MKYLKYYCFFILIVLVFAYINSNYITESFTPGIKAYTRPIIRRTRIVGESFINETSSNLENLSRRLGFM